LTPNPQYCPCGAHAGVQVNNVSLQMPEQHSLAF
jgi:hypothetical protein